MWKMAVGFIAFAALALYVLSRGGDIDMSGEKHGTDTAPAHPVATAASATVSTPVAAPASAPASAASAPASAAKP